MPFLRIDASALLLLLVSASAQEEGIWEGSASTEKGCDCRTECGTSMLSSCYAQPYCYVENDNCLNGQALHSTLHGAYDYCKFDSYFDYEHKTAVDKHSLLLAKIRADQTSSSYPSPLSIFGESVSLSFDAVADVFPMQRKKVIHGVGVVGSIRFESNQNHKYTGLFRTGVEHGFIRFSSAKEPSSSGFTPGFAIKFLRDGKPSANFVAMPSLDGQKCEQKNFFDQEFKNHISATSSFALQLVARKFWQGSFCPLMVGLSDVAQDDDLGAEDPVEFPYMVKFKAPDDTVVDCPCDAYTTECFDNFGKLSKGTTLFKVFAAASPNADFEEIGSIILTDKFTPSKFGDEQLFFKHQHMEDDFKLKPGWLEEINKKDACGTEAVGVNPPTFEHGCKSPFNGAKPIEPQDATDDILV